MPLNRPTKRELLTAVSEYLQQAPQDANADLFYRRVAANVLAIVQREEQLAADYARQERDALQQILHSNEADLAQLNLQLNQAIDSGDLAINPQLTHLLLQLSQAKLAIDNPKYRL